LRVAPRASRANRDGGKGSTSKIFNYASVVLHNAACAFSEELAYRSLSREASAADFSEAELSDGNTPRPWARRPGASDRNGGKASS